MTIDKFNLPTRLVITFYILVFLGVCCSAAENQPATNSGSYKYDKAIELQGVVKGLAAYGPPGYGEGENPKDAVVHFYVLKISTPINVNKSEDFPAESNVSEIQLAIGWHDKKKIFGTEKAPNLVNENILVMGTLYHSHTGYHHRPVLMDVEKIVLLKKGFFHSVGIKLLNFYESIFKKPTPE